MAAPIYTNDLITIAVGDLNFDLGTWDESSDAGWDTAGAMVDDENLWYTDNSINTGEAASSCTSAQYTKIGTGSGAAGPGTIMYAHTAAFTVPTDGVCIIHHLWAAPPALNPTAGTFLTAEAGISVLIGDSLGVFDVFYVSGDDRAPAPEGGWATYAVDPTLTPDGSVGAPTTTTMVGVAVAALAQARGNPQACQAVRYGRAEVEYTVGDATTPATFEGYALIDNVAADRFNLLQKIEGGYRARGLMSFGTAATAVYFKDSNKSIVIADDYKVGSAFNKGIVTNALSVLDWTNIAITNLSAIAKYTFTVNDSATTDHIGCVFTDLGAFTYGPNSTQTNSIFRRQALITQGSSTFTGCTFDDSANAIALSVNSISLVTDNTFNGDGTSTPGHAVALGTLGSVGGDIISWNNILVNTGNQAEWTGAIQAPTTVNTGDANSAILVNIATGNSLKISVADTGTIPTVYVTGGGSLEITAGEYDFIISGLEINTEVTVLTAGTQIVLFHVEDTSVSDGDGKYKVTYTHGGGEIIDVLIHNIHSVPDISNIYNLTLASAAGSAKVQMFDDPYYNGSL